MWPKDYREEWYEFLNLYSRLVGMYSVRNLSFSSDVLVAFSGVKAGLEHCFEANFIFGLPEAIFDVALMWRPSGWIDRRDRTAMICFPSWCWTGWVGKIHYSFDSRDLYDKDNESSKFKVLSEIESFQIYNQGTFRTIERHKSTYHNRPNPKAPFSPPTAVDNNLNRGVLQFSAFIVPAKYFHIKRYDSSGFSIGKPGSIALISVEDEVRGYLYDGGVLKSKSLKHDSFEFVLLSRVSRPFEERTFFEGFEKFEWDIVNVLVVEWKGLYAERVAVGFMHASLWEKSYTTRKFIRLA
jgi:hypothetical protein